jgi:rare lipoprotein A
MAKMDPRLGVSASPRVIAPGQPVPKGGGHYVVGSPYTVGGRTYVPQEDPHYRAEGLASWYGEDFHGRLTANGEVYDMESISAASPVLPLPCYARVTNLKNGRSIIVRVNDRGPYHSDRLIDLSTKTAHLLDFYGDGLAHVRVEYVGQAPLQGSDDHVLLATLRINQPAPAPSGILLASSHAFLPTFGERASVRGEVPIPPERPFTLGQNQGSSASEPPPSTVAAARPRRPARPSLDDRFAANHVPSVITEVPRHPSPVSAYATSPATQAAPSIMTGRGLY